MAPTRPLSRPEFIALMAMLSGTVAFSIDSMLAAFPEIGAELSPDALNNAQLIITIFVLGMGLGTIAVGPLSDRFGRRAVMLWGAAIYSISAFVAWLMPTLEGVLIARFFMGIGGAGPRVVALAVTRDLFTGREMARIMSFIMVVFSIVPAIGPSIGAVLIAYAGWRSIFISFICFSLISSVWLFLRLPETLKDANRRPLAPRSMWAAAKQVMAHPSTRTATMVQMLSMSILFAVLSSTQQIFDITFDRARGFPLWFALISVLSATSGIINARLVGRLGMRPMIKGMFIAQIIISGLMIVAYLAGVRGNMLFAIYMFWTTAVFFQAGLTLGNLNALAMEPMGHIAGMAASLISGFATIGAVVFAIPIGLLFDGTPLPNAIGVFLLSIWALWLTLKIKRDSDTA